MICLEVREPVDGYLEKTGHVTFDPHEVQYHGDEQWLELLLERAGERDGSARSKAKHVARTVAGTGVRVELADLPEA